MFFKYGDITYINSKNFFHHQQNLCAPLSLLEGSDIKDGAKPHSNAAVFWTHHVEKF